MSQNQTLFYLLVSPSFQKEFTFDHENIGVGPRTILRETVLVIEGLDDDSPVNRSAYGRDHFFDGSSVQIAYALPSVIRNLEKHSIAYRVIVPDEKTLPIVRDAKAFSDSQALICEIIDIAYDYDEDFDYTTMGECEDWQTAAKEIMALAKRSVFEIDTAAPFNPEHVIKTSLPILNYLETFKAVNPDLDEFFH